MSDADSEQQAHDLLRRIFGLLGECRGLQTQLGTPPAESERPGARAERELYALLLAALEDGLRRAIEEALRVLQHASAPRGLRGEEWLARQEEFLDGEGRAR